MENVNHGIFINYKRSNKHTAIRIYDYFKNKGLNPFLDLYYTSQTKFYDFIIRKVEEAPYFLCVLTADGLRDLLDPALRDRDPDADLYYQEIKTACERKKDIFLLVSKDIKPEDLARLPEEIKKIDAIKDIRGVSYDLLPDDNLFDSLMDNLFKQIDLKMLREFVNWRNYSFYNANTLLLPHTELKNTTATLNNRFGKDFIDCVKSGEPYTGETRIKEINMVCYAASLVAAPERDKVDKRAYDGGIFSRVITYLVSDPSISFSIIMNAPLSAAAKDAVVYEKLGNSGFENNNYGAGVFLVAYANFDRLQNEEPYKSALANNRFDFMVTDCVLPYALFQIIYKDEWAEYNHIKVDLYSYGLHTSEDRRSMVVFEKDDKANYDFFVRQIETLKSNQNRKKSAQLIKKNHKKWIKEWEKLKKKKEASEK